MEEIVLARRIREIRTGKGFTLDELARRTGFTKGLLSKIENNKVSPPVSTLAKIARAMDVSMGDFFSTGNEAPIMIVRHAERMQYNPENSPPGSAIEALISGFHKQHMEPMIISIDDAEHYDAKFYNHPGQEFILVLQGTMAYHYDNQEYTINAGDCLYFNADLPHGPCPLLVAGLATCRYYAHNFFCRLSFFLGNLNIF